MTMWELPKRRDPLVEERPAIQPPAIPFHTFDIMEEGLWREMLRFGDEKIYPQEGDTVEVYFDIFVRNRNN